MNGENMIVPNNTGDPIIKKVNNGYMVIPSDPGRIVRDEDICVFSSFESLVEWLRRLMDAKVQPTRTLK